MLSTEVFLCDDAVWAPSFSKQETNCGCACPRVLCAAVSAKQIYPLCETKGLWTTLLASMSAKERMAALCKKLKGFFLLVFAYVRQGVFHGLGHWPLLGFLR